MKKAVIFAIVAIIAIIALVATLWGCTSKTTSKTTATTTTTTNTDVIAFESGHDGTGDYLRKRIVEAIRQNPGKAVTLDGSTLYEYSGTVYEVVPNEQEGTSLQGLFYTNSLEDYPYGEKGTEVYLSDGTWATAVMKEVGDLNENYLYVMKDGETVKRVQVSKESKVIGSSEGRIVVWSPNSFIDVWDINIGDWSILYDPSIYDDEVIDASAKYGTLWILTQSGKVYRSDWRNSDELKLVSENAVALSPNMSDAPGWFEPGEIDPEWDWVYPEIHARFVRAW